MIAILASRLDPEAQLLVAEWHSEGACLLSAEDLVQTGWEFSPNNPAAGVAVVSGNHVKVADLQAVLTRRPSVLAEELKQIDPRDRSYVAAETNSFLVAWLNALPCRVINRSTPRSLCGPAWDALHWRVAAASVGAAWAETNERSGEHEVIVCGLTCLGAKTPTETAIATALAKKANVDLLGVRFLDEMISQVTVAPSLNSVDVRSQLLSLLMNPL